MESNKISIFNIIAVILSATFAIYSKTIIAKATSLAKSLFKSKPSPQLLQLKAKIAETKKELHKISPTGEFAKYFKKDRELNKLNEELAELESKNSSENAKNLNIETAVRAVLQIGSLALLRYVSGITAYCIPNNIFWPFNIIMRFPAIFGNDSCPSDFAEVSGFALAFLMVHLINLAVKSVWRMKEQFSKKVDEKKNN